VIIIGLVCIIDGIVVIFTLIVGIDVVYSEFGLNDILLYVAMKTQLNHTKHMFLLKIINKITQSECGKDEKNSRILLIFCGNTASYAYKVCSFIDNACSVVDDICIELLLYMQIK
jgi:hypothetical protein